MKTCGWSKRVETLHDGGVDDKAQAHVESCAACAAHLQRLARISDGVAAVRRQETIADGQFDAFMAGIHEEIGGMPAPRRGFWPMASLTAAAMVIALTVWGTFRFGFDQQAMTEVEAMETELEGASLDWTLSDDGVATLWVNFSEDDTW